MRLARRILRLRVRRLGLLPLQGEGVELRLLGGELLTSRIQVALGVGVRGDGDEHPGEGDDDNDDAQGHAGDDQPQDVCLLVRRPERYADGSAEATVPREQLNPAGAGLVCSGIVEEHAPALLGTLVRLRTHEPADIAALNDLIDDPEVGESLGMVMPQPVSGYQAFIEMIDKDPSKSSFVIERIDGGVPIGGCSFFAVETAARTALLGIWLGKPYGTRAWALTPSARCAGSVSII